jgi:hypothetical protein
LLQLSKKSSSSPSLHNLRDRLLSSGLHPRRPRLASHARWRRSMPRSIGTLPRDEPARGLSAGPCLLRLEGHAAKRQRSGSLRADLAARGLGSCSYCRKECRNCCGAEVLNCPPSASCLQIQPIIPPGQLGTARALAKVSPQTQPGSSGRHER